MRLCLYQPDIAQNTGTILRLCACFAVSCDIIEPCGFPFSDARFKRAGMDYLDQIDLKKYTSFDDFMAQKRGRVILLTTKADMSYTAFDFEPGDILMLGRESSGVPEDVHKRVDARIKIPLKAGTRSLNVAVAGSIVLSEALRQLGKLE